MLTPRACCSNLTRAHPARAAAAQRQARGARAAPGMGSEGMPQPVLPRIVAFDLDATLWYPGARSEGKRGGLLPCVASGRMWVRQRHARPSMACRQLPCDACVQPCTLAAMDPRRHAEMYQLYGGAPFKRDASGAVYDSAGLCGGRGRGPKGGQRAGQPATPRTTRPPPKRGAPADASRQTPVTPHPAPPLPTHTPCLSRRAAAPARQHAVHFHAASNRPRLCRHRGGLRQPN